MKPAMLIAAATVMTIAIASPVGTIAFAQQTSMQMQQSQKGQMSGQTGSQTGAMKKPGGMQGGMMGMKGQGGGMMGMMAKMRKRMMGKQFMVRKKPYTNADIKRMIDGRLAAHGFSRLKAGDVRDGAKEGPKTATVDVVSTKGEFLYKVQVNRKTGMAAIIE